MKKGKQENKQSNFPQFSPPSVLNPCPLSWEVSVEHTAHKCKGAADSLAPPQPPHYPCPDSKCPAVRDPSLNPFSPVVNLPVQVMTQNQFQVPQIPQNGPREAQDGSSSVTMAPWLHVAKLYHHDLWFHEAQQSCNVPLFP